MRRVLRRRLAKDRLARRIVRFGGLTIIVSILAILIVILAEVYPLFLPARADALGPLPLAEPQALLVGCDEYREIAYVAAPHRLAFVELAETGGEIPDTARALDSDAVSVSAGHEAAFALGLQNGHVLPVAPQFDVSFVKGRRVIEPSWDVSEPIVVFPDGAPVSLFSFVRGENGPVVAAVRDGTLHLVLVRETESLMGGATREEIRHAVPLPGAVPVTAVAMDGRGEDVYLGTAHGTLLRVSLRDPERPVLEDEGLPLTAGAAITTLSFLLGDRTLVVGAADGSVVTWQLLQRGAARRMVKLNTFTPHEGAVRVVRPSLRNKGFVTMDAGGHIALRYGTTGKTVLQLRAPGLAATAAAMAPKADGVIAATPDGFLQRWTLRNPHPEVTWRSLFGKMSYEGYEEPAQVWQSTGGTDDFEAKFSLTPLVFGTLKGTLYAMVVAIPLALLGALYASQFMHPSLKQTVKPVIEIMAALPSVVLGFVAGLWMAPFVESVVPALLITPFVTAATIFLALMLWKVLPGRTRLLVRPGYEIFLLVPVVLLGGWLSLQGGGWFEQVALAGDYRHWLKDVLGLTYDQRNSLVVGLAMGFAVIPIIFTIAEDSLSSVPHGLKAASLALGATPWQTAVRVILPTASPGIFSAIMIGLGRAVGETMIVLMATGNTPVMNWSIFSGFRALSANIAVELPEAPAGGTLYRVLFLAALLLFAMTFVLNTIAELIRLRLRARYRVL